MLCSLQFLMYNLSDHIFRLLLSQLIAGVGLPVDLEVESLTVGYVFKAEYFLPVNASQWYDWIKDPFEPHPIEAEGGRRKRSAIADDGTDQKQAETGETNVERYVVEAKVISDDNDQQDDQLAEDESHWYEENESSEEAANNNYSLEDIKNKSPQDLSHSRFTLYKGIQKLAELSGVPGRPCLLRSICETAEVPFSYSNGILGELAHLIMT